MATYDVTDQTTARRVQFTGNGTAGPFAFAFQVNATSEVKVYVDTTEKTETSHYTVTLNSSTGAGTISFTTGNHPTSSQTITILSDIPLSRTSVYTSGGQLTASSLEDDFDTNMFVHQQTNEEINRSLRQAEHDVISGADMTLPVKDTRKGTVLGFNATTGNPEAGPNITAVQTLADVTTAINLLGTSDVVTDMGLLATSAVIEDMGLLATSSNISAMALLGTSDVVADMALLGTSDVVADMALLADSDVISDMNTLATSDIISDLNTLATSDIVTDMNLLATSANVTAMGLLGTSANVTAMGLLGTSAVVEDMGLLATSAVIEDMGLLATSAVIEDMGILGTSSNVTAMANVSGSITNVNTVATNLSGVNSFAERYRVASSAPSTSLDIGDLYFDTTANELKVYKSSGWASAGSTVNGTSERFTYNITGTPTTLTGASGTGFSEANGNTLAYDAGFLDVYLNGVKMVNGTDVTVTSGTSVVFASALSNGDVVDIVTFGTFNVANIVSTGALNSGSITSGFGNIDNGSSTITTTGAITGGSLVADNITIDGTEIDLSSGDLTIDVASNINLDADGGTISLKDGGTEVGRIILNSNGGDLLVTSRVSDKDIVFTGNDGGSQTEFMRIDSSEGGRVGIGEASPDTPLHITYTKDVAFSADNFTQEANVGLKIENTSSTANAMSIMQFRTGSGADLFFGIEQQSANAGDFIFGNQNSTDVVMMRVKSAGNVCIGDQTTPFSSDATLNIDQLGGGFPILCHRSGTGDGVQISFRNDNGQVGRINTNGSSTSYVTSSDYRLKENVVEMSDATTRLKQLQPKRFNFIADADTTIDGFLAHEVQSIVPEAITGTHNEVETWEDGEELPDGVSVGDNKLDDNGNTIPKYQGIDQSKLVPLLVKTIQELEARITALESA